MKLRSTVRLPPCPKALSYRTNHLPQACSVGDWRTMNPSRWQTALMALSTLGLSSSMVFLSGAPI